MSAPREPGQGRPADAADGPGRGAATSGDVPPWQRGGARRPTAPAERSADAGRSPGSAPPNADAARLNRFMTGGGPSAPPREGRDPAPREGREAPREPSPREAPPREPSPRDASTRELRDPRESPGREVDRAEPPRAEAYASELPDLSGPNPGANPRAPQRKSAERSGAERGTSEPTRSTSTQLATRNEPGPLRASMQIRRFDPWSVLKVSALLSVTLFFVWMIAVALLYLVLGGMGVWAKLNSNVGDLLTSTGGSGGELVSSGTIFGGAALIGLVNIVLLTAMATCGAFIYNLSTDIVGGIEVTLADRD